MAERNDFLSEIKRIRENAWCIDDLRGHVRSRLGVIPFVGAGLSRPFGFPLWAEFLRQQAKLAGIVEAISRRIKRGEYEEAASDIERTRGSGRFAQAIHATFGSRAFENRTFTTAMSLLPRLCSGAVITTNFDLVLESAFARAGASVSSPPVGQPGSSV